MLVAISIGQLDAPSTHLHRVCYGELGLLLGVAFILAEVLTIQEGQSEVDHAGRVRARIAQQQVNAEHLLARSLERDGPPVIAEAEVLGCGIPVEVARNRLGHDEGEDTGFAAVVEPAEPVQERHFGSCRLLASSLTAKPALVGQASSWAPTPTQTSCACARGRAYAYLALGRSCAAGSGRMYADGSRARARG